MQKDKIIPIWKNKSCWGSWLIFYELSDVILSQRWFNRNYNRSIHMMMETFIKIEKRRLKYIYFLLSKTFF